MSYINRKEKTTFLIESRNLYLKKVKIQSRKYLCTSNMKKNKYIFLCRGIYSTSKLVMIQNKYTIITIDTGTKLIIDHFENQHSIAVIIPIRSSQSLSYPDSFD